MAKTGKVEPVHLQFHIVRKCKFAEFAKKNCHFDNRSIFLSKALTKCLINNQYLHLFINHVIIKNVRPNFLYLNGSFNSIVPHVGF